MTGPTATNKLYTILNTRRFCCERVARLTGDECFKLTDAKSFKRDFAAIAHHLPNRYVLTFHPQAPHLGLHSIAVRVPDYPELVVTATTSYWADNDSKRGDSIAPR